MSAATPLLQTAASSLGTIETERRISELPLNGRAQSGEALTAMLSADYTNAGSASPRPNQIHNPYDCSYISGPHRFHRRLWLHAGRSDTAVLV